MFADIGIRLEWTACEPAGIPSPAPVLVEVVSGTPEGFKSGVLGYAMPFQVRHVIIFFDRIATMPIAYTALAHVMVHEIAHVIQGVSRHSQIGLMKAHWTGRDLLEMQYKPLPFTTEDLTLLYRGLTAARDMTPTECSAQESAQAEADRSSGVECPARGREL
jgi:hypothetical protein